MTNKEISKKSRPDLAVTCELLEDDICKPGRVAEKLANYEKALGVIDQGVVMYDKDLHLVFSNKRYAEIYDVDPSKIVPGMHLDDIVKLHREKGIHGSDCSPTSTETRSALFSSVADKMLTLSDGRTIMIRRRAIEDGSWAVTHMDFTERVRMEMHMCHMAEHDSMTGLANRIKLNRRLKGAVERVRRGETIALLSLDLDRFKGINDTYGHAFGDELLKQVANRIENAIRPTDTAARIGGDEFIVLQTQVKNGAKDAAALAGRLVDIISEPYEIDDNIVFTTPSIGIFIAEDSKCDADEIMKNAGFALYRAKSEGRGTYRLFGSKMDSMMKSRQKIESELRAAIVKEEFEVFYQPIMNLEQKRVTSFEALIRWNHPERGLVSPFEFIPIAEETGLIVPIGHWVLQRACLEATKWPEHISVAINMSSIQFKGEGPVQQVKSALKKSGLPASRLVIEITESLLFTDFESALYYLKELRAMGVRLALDDFGTGYSSLSYMSSFPFDKIKLDRSFVKELPGEEKSLAIMRCVAGLGKSLGMATTAEGVETQEQLDVAISEGCTEVQGYFFSTPRPASEIADVVEKCAEKAKSTSKSRVLKLVHG